MKKRILTFSLLIFLSVTSFSQEDKQYTETLNKMFEVSGTEGSYQAAIKEMFSMFKQQYSNVEVEIWTDLEKEFSKKSLNELTKMLVPVYSKYMTLEDLNELIKFYNTPTGKKYAKSTPLIMQESMQIGQQWGMKIGQDFEKKMKDRGY